ncbi:MAG: tetratricopeptide repeat protein [Deltaproteobacteria bacterium]|nr:tetratricopeptide repeat protein [Myxococcales bacterium]MDP3212982.1 tetratricopeptide repeat protein [Deltaproteobacteria bacterium]
MPDALPVPYERNVRRVVRAVQASPRGGLFICVGRSQEVRARVEAELDARLAPGRVVVRASLEGAGGEPWRTIVAARDASGRGADETVLSVGIGGGGASEADEARDAEVLLRLNVGREVRVQQRLHLLLWVEGLVQLDRVRMKAPDLWAFRLDELFFLSAADFDVAWLRTPEIMSFEQHLARIDRRLASTLVSTAERVDLLSDRAAALRSLGRPQEALASIEQGRRALRDLRWTDQVRDVLRSNLLWGLLTTLALLGRIHEAIERARQLHHEAVASKNVLLKAATAEALAELLPEVGGFRAAIEASDEAISTIPTSRNLGHPVPLGGAGFYVVRSSIWLGMGAIDRSAAECSEAKRVAATSWMPESVTLSIVETSRADTILTNVDLARGKIIDALLLTARVAAQRESVQHSDGLDVRRQQASSMFERLGFLDIASLIAREGVRSSEGRHDVLCRAAWLCALGRIDDLLVRRNEALCRYRSAATLLDRWHRESPTGRVDAALMLARIYADLLPLLLDAPEADHYRGQAESLLLDALKSSRKQRHVDLELKCQEALARLYVSTGRFDAASRCLHAVLKSAERYKGPSALAATWIDLARVEHARGDLPAALAHFDHARAQCERDEPLYRSRFVWKRLMVERHRTEAALGDLRAAKASLDDALTVLRAEGLRLEEMDVLQHLAELAPAPGTDDHREGAAYAALEIARDAMFPSDEARAMLTLVELGLAAGQRDAVAGQYREAAWIARELGPRELRRRAERLAHHFGGLPSP